MIVTALVENSADEKYPELEVELGLAIHIDRLGKAILFDAGASDAFLHNAATLGVDLSGVGAVVISHGHYDHVEGLPGFFRINDRANVHLHARAADGHFIKLLGFIRRGVGIRPALLTSYPNRFLTVRKTAEIEDGVFIVTSLSQRFPLPPDRKFFFSVKNESLVLDDFSHEVILAFREEDGIVAFAGGCHCGVLNAVETLRQWSPGVAIKALFCGFHTVRLPFVGIMPGGRVDVDGLARTLSDMEDVKKIYTCHSTDRFFFHRMKKVMGDKLEYFATGCRVEV